MTTYSLSRRVPYSIEQIFRIAGNVADYKEFLPLVKRSTVRNRTTLPDGRTTFDAEIAVVYSKLGISETMTSKVVVDPAQLTVKSHCSDGPVKSLDSEWKLVSVGPNDTEIRFTVNYVLRSRSLQFLISGMFDMMLRRVLRAFEQRAHKLYGPVAA